MRNVRIRDLSTLNWGKMLVLGVASNIENNAHSSAVISSTGSFLIDGGHYEIDPCRDGEDRVKCHIAQQMRALRRVFAVLTETRDFTVISELGDVSDLLVGWAEGTKDLPAWYRQGKNEVELRQSTMSKVKNMLYNHKGTCTVVNTDSTHDLVEVAGKLSTLGISGLFGTYSARTLSAEAHRIAAPLRAVD